MERTVIRRVLRLGLPAALVAIGAAGCTVQSQEPSEFQGPSELAEASRCKPLSGTSDPTIAKYCTITMTASPDRLPQDGSSQAVITALVQNEQMQPVANMSLRWTVTSSDGNLVVPSVQIGVTDAAGRASTIVTAPPAPQVQPTTASTMRIEVEPIAYDSQAVFGDPSIPRRSVVVELVPPSGTPLANRLPVPSFTVTPPISNVTETVTLDASLTTDEGSTCNSRCTFYWDFGDNTIGNGMVVTHRFDAPGSITITLRVVDDRSGSASTTRTLTVVGPAFPTANFTTAQAVAGGPVTFNAFSSSVGAGATLVEYNWDFGDGSSQTTSQVVVQKTYAAPGTYVAKLTVKDNLGRVSTVRILQVIVT